MSYELPSFNDFNEEYEDLQELLKRFENLKEGRSHAFLDEDSFEQIIDYYDEHDEINKALQAVDFGIDQYPFSSTLLLKKAALLIESKQYEEALALLDRVAALDATDISLYILQTDVYLALSQHAKAAQILEEQITSFSGSDRSELLLELADVYDDWEQFPKVFDCLRMLLEWDPTNEEALHKICFWTDFTGRNQESVQLHKQIIEEQPYSHLAWFNLGTAYQGLKEYENSIEAYQYAIVIDERFDYAYRNMGDAYIQLRRYPEAIEVMKKHLEIAKPEDVIYEAIGHCYEKMRRFTQARYYYRKASHLSPTDDKIISKIAKSYMQEENWMSAVKTWGQALKLQKQNLEYNINMGFCLLEMEQDKEALVYFLNAIRIRPASIPAWKALIRALYATGHMQESLSQLDEAEEKIGKKPAFHFYRAGILIAMGKTKEGLLQLEDALTHNPKQVKHLIELDPSLLQLNAVIEMLARFRKKR
jgi:tetratricopeptide (TPR) repeat protein